MGADLATARGRRHPAAGSLAAAWARPAFRRPPLHPVATRSRAAGTAAMVYYLSNTPGRETIVMPHWNDKLPIYRQLADLLAAGLLDGDPPEGEPMPSVRTLAGQYLLNPLTVHRALQALGDDGLLETRRGIGSYVQPGARQRLRSTERERFLNDEWPLLRARLRRLGIGATQLKWED